MHTVKLTLSVAVPLLAIVLAGCSGEYVGQETKRWTVFETRDMPYEKAWTTVRNVLIESGYFFETTEKSDGYLRTQWRYPEDIEIDYPVRVHVKFTTDGACTVRVLAECMNCGVHYQDIPRLRNLLEELRDRLL